MTVIIVLAALIAAAWLAFGLVWVGLDLLEATVNDEPMPTWRAVLCSLLLWPWASRW